MVNQENAGRLTGGLFHRLLNSYGTVLLILIIHLPMAEGIQSAANHNLIGRRTVLLPHMADRNTFPYLVLFYNHFR